MTTTTSALVDLRMLTRYSAWANRVLYERLREAPAEVLQAPQPGRPGGTAGMLGVLGHIYAVSLIWKGHLTGEPHGFTTRTLDAVPPLAELQSLQAAVDRWYVGFAEREPAERLGRTIAFSFVDGGAGAMRACDMLLHIVNHGSYHRGTVADMLYAAGMRPPTMDLPVYLRDAGASGG